MANNYDYYVPSLQTARPYETMVNIAKDIKLPYDNALVAVYNKESSYGYIPFQFTQVMQIHVWWQ